MDNNSQKNNYTIQKNYNKSISTPDYVVGNRMKINMQSIDSIDLNNTNKIEVQNIIEKDEDKKEKKEEIVPDISEIYGNNKEKQKENRSTTKKTETKENILNTPVKNGENIIAIVSAISIIVLIIVSIILFNIFIS